MSKQLNAAVEKSQTRLTSVFSHDQLGTWQRQAILPKLPLKSFLLSKMTYLLLKPVPILSPPPNFHLFLYPSISF